MNTHMQSRPLVTQIFPKNNGQLIPNNLSIRKIESRENVLKSGGFNHLNFDNNSMSTSTPLLLGSNNTCIDIAQHIDTCPICSRLYDTDKTLYILAIIGLLILCFLMVKRIIKL